MDKKLTIYDYRQLKFKEVNRVIRMLKRKLKLEKEVSEVLTELTKILYLFFRRSLKENAEKINIIPITTKEDEFIASKIIIEASIQELKKISKETKVE